MHQKENDKIYTFTNDRNYSLERVSDLILRDLRSGSFLKKNRKFEGTDFQHVKQNIKDIDKLSPSYPATQQENEPLLMSNENESSLQILPTN